MKNKFKPELEGEEVGEEGVEGDDGDEGDVHERTRV